MEMCPPQLENNPNFELTAIFQFSHLCNSIGHSKRSDRQAPLLVIQRALLAAAYNRLLLLLLLFETDTCGPAAAAADENNK